MDAVFATHIEALRPRLAMLLSMTPVTPAQLPKLMPKTGVYLFSERGEYLYVGRSKDIRKRIKLHSLPSASHRKASFAFRLARKATGNLTASYIRGKGAREDLMNCESFVVAFSEAKARIREMELRFVEESDPVRQALLEIYVAIVLQAPFNNFETH